MSKQVDERVVQMKFDNSNFEQNVKTSMSTLDKLKSALKFDKISDGIDKIGASFKGVDTSVLANGVETVTAKFSALQVMGITALSNITNKAVDAGLQITKSLTIDPVSTGFSMYETKLTAIQTIMAGTGESLETVKSELADLNDYSNKTIYSFQDMTDSVGKFTNNGLKLDETKEAIKGICNWAALAGANTQQASAAMYNLSQSLASGNLQLIDYKSIENANMGTKQFKDLLIDTALEMGTLKKVTDETGKEIEHCGETAKGNQVNFKNFRDSLQDKWATTEVMMATFKKYSDTESELGSKALAAAADIKSATQLMDVLKEEVSTGWSDTFELIIGDLDQAKKLWGAVYTAVGGALDVFTKARNDILRGALQGSSNAWSELSSTIEKCGIDVDDFKKRIEETAKSSDKHAYDLIVKAGGIDEAISKGCLNANLIAKTLRSYTTTASAASGATKELTGKFDDFSKIIDNVINGDFKNGEDRAKALTKAGYDYAKIQDLVNKKLNGEKVELEDLSETQLESIGYTNEQIEAIKRLAYQSTQTGTHINDLIKQMSRPSGRDLLLQSLSNIYVNIVNIANMARKAWNDVFGADTKSKSEALYNAIKGFDELTEKLKLSSDALEDVKRTFTGIFKVLKLCGTILGDFIESIAILAGAILPSADEGIVSITGDVGDVIGGFANWAEQNVFLAKVANKLAPHLQNLSSIICDIFRWASEVVHLIANSVRPYIKRGLAYIEDGINLIKQAAKYLYDLPIVQEAIEKIKEEFGEFPESLEDVAKSFKNVVTWAYNKFAEKCPEMAEKLSKFKDQIKSLLPEELVTRFSDFGSYIEQFVKDCKSLDGVSFENLGKIFDFFKTDVLDKLFGPNPIDLSSITDDISNFSLKGETFLGRFSSAVDNCKTALEEFVGFIQSKFSGITVSKILGLIVGIEVIKTLYKVARDLSNFASAFSGVGEVLENVGVAIKKTAKAEAFKVTAGSLLMLVGALTALALMIEYHGVALLLAVGLLTGLGGALVYMINSISKGLSKLDLKDLGKLSAVLLSLGGTLVMLAISLKIVASITDGGALLSGIVALVGLIAAIAGAIWLMSKVGENVNKAAITIVAIGVAVKMLVSALAVLALIPTDTLLANLPALGEVMIGVIALMAISAVAGEEAKAGGIGLLAVAGALYLLTKVTKILTNMTPEELQMALNVVRMAVLVMAALFLLSNLASADKVKGISDIGTTMLKVSASLIILALASKLLANIPIGALIKAAGAMVVMGIVISTLMTVMNDANSQVSGIKQGVATAIQIAAIAGAVLVMSVALMMLSAIPLGSLTKATIAMIAIGAMLGVVVYVSKNAKDSMAAVIAITACIVAIGVMVIAMSMLDPESLKTATFCMMGLMGVLAIVLVVSKFAAKVSPSILLLLAVIGGLAAIVWALTTVCDDINGALKVSIGLSVLLLALSGSLAILAGVSTIAGAALISAGILAVIAGVIGLVIGLLMKYAGLTEGAGTVAAGLGVFLLAAAVAVAILAGIGPVAASAILGALGLAAVLAVIGGVMGWMAKWLTSKLVSASEDLPKIADNLSSFAEKLSPFIDTVSKLNDGGIDGVNKLVEMVNTLTGAGIFKVKMSANTKGIDNFAKQLEALGGALVKFNDSIADLSTEKVDEAIEEITKLNDLGSTLNSNNGASGLNNFSNQLGQVGTDSVTNFCNTFIGSTDRVSNATATMMGAAAQGINAGKQPVNEAAAGVNSDLIAALTSGDMSGLGMDQITQYASGLYGGSGAVTSSGTGINSDLIAALTSGDMSGLGMDQIAQYTSGLNGGREAVTSSGTGINSDLIAALTSGDMSGLGTDQITQYASGLYGGSGAVTDSAALISQLTGSSFQSNDMAGAGVAETASFASGLSNEESLTSTTTAATTVAQSVYDTLAKFDMTGAGTAAVTSFSTGISSATTGELSESVSSLMTSITNGITNNSATVNSSMTSVITSMLTSMRSRFPEFLAVGSQFDRNIAAGILNNGTLINTNMTTIINNLLTAIRARYEEFQIVGRTIIARITSAMLDNMTKVTSTAKMIGNEVYSTLYNYDMSGAGAAVVAGFANGIRDHSSWATDAAKKLGDETYDALKDAIKQGSPSKLTYQSGRWFVMGLTNGINYNARMASNAAEDLGNDTLNALNGTIAAIVDAVNSDIDTQPTIRPVLDLSDIEAGAGQISSMFNAGQAMQVGGLFNASAAVAGEIQNGGSQGSSGATIQFTQNNYSPKSLSRYDIYRQTRNQLSAFERWSKA